MSSLPYFRRPLRARSRWPLGALVCLTLLGSCARVAPYERETLARRDMDLAREGELTAGEQHGQAYREASSGGGEAQGGGCGCN